MIAKQKKSKWQNRKKYNFSVDENVTLLIFFIKDLSILDVYIDLGTGYGLVVKNRKNVK